ncbi:MAG: hypothetical protein ACNS63_13265 [Candidatus Nitrospinota bacterium M3_3B_026]
MNIRELREKHRLDTKQLGQLMRGLDSMRKSGNRAPDFWDDVGALFREKYPGSSEEREAKQAWFEDILKFIQRHGRSLIEADYIRSDEGTVSINEDLMGALVNARLRDEPDEEGVRLDGKSVLEKLAD